MKYLNDQRGVALVLELVLVAAVLVIAGVGVYAAMHQKSSPVISKTAATSLSPTPTPADQQLIVEMLKAHDSTAAHTPNAGTKYVLCKLAGGYASVLDVPGGTNVAGGGNALLKKSQGVWGISYEGQNLDEATATQLGFPQGFGNACSSQSPVIYTY